MNYLLLSANAGEGGSQNLLGALQLPIMIGVFGLFAYFFIFLPEKKRKKKAADMLSNIQIADEVVTAGGIVGRVIDVKPEADTIVIETGGDKTRLRILRGYIIENRTVHD